MGKGLLGVAILSFTSFVSARAQGLEEQATTAYANAHEALAQAGRWGEHLSRKRKRRRTRASSDRSFISASSPKRSDDPKSPYYWDGIYIPDEGGFLVRKLENGEEELFKVC